MKTRKMLKIAFILLFINTLQIGRVYCSKSGICYVSPHGNDINPGTLGRPVASIQKAIELSREQNLKTIRLKGGNYYNVCIELTREDSGLSIEAFPGENPDSLNAIVPSGNYIIRFADGANNIRISGLSISTTSHPLINPGYAACLIDGAIRGENTTHILIDHCTIEDHAGWGIKILGNYITIRNCLIRNTGAGGICFNGKNITVDSCEVYNAGLVYSSSVGIIGGDGPDNRISHCDIYNIPYCAIGGVGKKSVVSDCLIYDFKTFAHDGGAIYQYGGDSTIYRHNVTICNPERRISGWTFYFDELSKNCIAEKNLALNTICPLQLHMSNRILFRNNLFIDNGRQELVYALSSDITLEKNIFVGDTIVFIGPKPKPAGELIYGNDVLPEPLKKQYSGATGINKIAGNILNSKSGSVLQQELILYSNQRTSRVEPSEGLQFADPRFRDIETGDFSFTGNSPARELNIEPLGFANVGCTGSFYKIYMMYYSIQY